MKKVLALLMVLAVSLFAVSAFAYDVKVDDDTYAKVGGKVQIRLTAINWDGPTPGDVDMTVQQARFYMAGQVTNLVKFGMNLDFNPGNAIANDAFIMLDFSKEAKLMSGIYRVAFSRVGLQDSYQFILIDAPTIVNAVAPVSTPTPTANFRNAGVTLWGDLMDGKLRYNVGVWDDDYSYDNGGTGKYAYTARVVFNFADPEKGYTCPGCYLGKANVMNIGVGYLMNDYTNVAGADKTNSAYTVDFFYDQGGTTLEAAYVTSDKDTGAVAGGDKPAGYYVEGAFMAGNWQPALRYESFDADIVLNDNTDYTTITAGINYLWSGHDAKFQLAYAMRDYDGNGEDVDALTAQLQVQF